MTNTNDLPEWSDYLALMSKADTLLAQLPDSDDPQQRQELYRLMFAAITTGYHSAFNPPGSPDFVPAVSNVLNTIGVNPDFIYGYTPLDGSGSYRISGVRGCEVFILMDLSGGGFGVLDEFGPSLGTIDFDTLHFDENGYFELLLSAEKPGNYSGDWHYLDPKTKTVNIRKAYYDWGEGQEARIAIERLDDKPVQTRLSADDIANRLRLLSGYIERYVGFILGYGKRQREQGLINKLEHDDWAGQGGVSGQHYYQGLFELQPGEVLLLETELPESVRYWNIQVNDILWNTIDWFNHQSSINGHQAVLDSDGKFRAVIAVDDPGISNWLDTGGHNQGSLMLRWSGASSGPEPRLTIVSAADIRSHLPMDTPQVSTEQRQNQLRERHRNAQWRRRW
ncbi:MAG: DUF1214 domain-containing protein [Spongiibacteraceae bacterium]